ERSAADDVVEVAGDGLLELAVAAALVMGEQLEGAGGELAGEITGEAIVGSGAGELVGKRFKLDDVAGGEGRGAVFALQNTVGGDVAITPDTGKLQGDNADDQAA